MREADDRALVCLFVKTPVPGCVKTRLAVDLGADGALAAYVELVEHGIRALQGSRFPVCLWVEGDTTHPTITDWAQRLGAPVRPQVDGDLGAKMQAALADGLASCPTALVIGSDLPEVDADYLFAAHDLLATHDVVFGPTEDGGYALVGARQSVPEIFQDIDWSTERVLDQSLNRAQSRGLSVGLLPVTWDVDDVDDWRRFQKLTRAGRDSR